MEEKMKGVYVLRLGDRDRFKIGKTSIGVDSRIRSFRTGNPDTSVEIDRFETDAYLATCEKCVQHKLRSKRVHGRRDTFNVSFACLGAILEWCHRFWPDFSAAKQEAERWKDAESDGRMLEPTDEDRATMASL